MNGTILRKNLARLDNKVALYSGSDTDIDKTTTTSCCCLDSFSDYDFWVVLQLVEDLNEIVKVKIRWFSLILDGINLVRFLIKSIFWEMK